MDRLRKAWPDLSSSVLIDLQLEEFKPAQWREAKIDNTFFLGCHFDGFESQAVLAQRDAAICLPSKGYLTTHSGISFTRRTNC